MNFKPDKSGPTITAVVVTYRSSMTIADTMESMKRSYDAGVLRCIVVDNKSDDETVDILKNYKSWANIIENSDNVGFGRGCNLGLEQVDTEYVMFVNPDSTIEPDSVKLLLEFMNQRDNVELVAPAINEPGGGVQGVGNLASPWNTLLQEIPLIKAPGRRPLYPGEKPFKTDWICGAIMVGRTGFLRRLKGFDPRFFLYFDETDLCRRILDEGAEIWCVGEAVAYHIGAASSDESSDAKFGDCIAEHYFQSRFYYFSKHHGLVMAVVAELGEIFLLGIRTLAARILNRGDTSSFYARMRGPVLKLPPKAPTQV